MDQQYGVLVTLIKSLRFFLWGHRKATVYAAEVSDVHDLQQRIQTEMRCSYKA
jgi:hypothetical protein